MSLFKDKFSNLFGKKNSEAESDRKNFKKQVLLFWETFEKEEANIRQMMINHNEQPDAQKLVGTMSNLIKIAFTDLPFEMGINKDDIHELILSPNGNRIILIQIMYLLRYKPVHLDKYWKFYSSKPAQGYEGLELGMYDLKIPANDFHIYTDLEEESKTINIKVLAPLLNNLQENEKYTTLFIMLDLFIGELYTMEYIGSVDFVEKVEEGEDSMPLFKLKSYIEYLINEHDWVKTKDLTQQYTGYRGKPAENPRALREDVYIGSTACFEIIRQFGQEDIYPVAAMEEDGVYMAYIYYDNSTVPDENMVNQRADIEDLLDEMLTKEGIAQAMGGATGSHNSYIDFIIYDLDAFVKTVREVMSKYDFAPKGIGFFQSKEQTIKL